MKNKKYIIFFQGNADFVQNLEYIRKVGFENAVCIVINNAEICDFLDQIKLKTYRVVSKSYNTIAGALSLKIELNRLLAIINSKYSFDRIVYNSNIYDLPTVYLINKLVKEKNIKITKLSVYDFGEYRIEKKINVIKKIFIRIFFGFETEYRLYGNQMVPYYKLNKPYKSLQISRFKKGNLTKLSSSAGDKVLFLENCGDVDKQYRNYDNDLSGVLDLIHSFGYKIDIKCHPRLGCSRILKKKNVNILAENLPIEIFDLSNYLAILAVDSIGLSNCIHEKKIGVTNLFNFDSIERKSYLVKYLRKQDEKIIFVKGKSELEEILCSI